ncbi:MAG: BatD family protein [candidate division Zixibacteria bacterium]|nr:BatD family protein [candidate division Zixibacteria bacterium]
MNKLLYIWVLLASFPGSSLAAEKAAPDTVRSATGITIETSVDKSEIYIGDLINYRLSIIHDSNIILTPPPIGANLGTFDVKDYQIDQTVKQKNGQIKSESRFLLTTFTTGEYVIPPIPIEFRRPDGTVNYLISEPTIIRVKSLLADSSDSADIRDIKEPLAFKTSRALYYYLAGAALLLLGGYYIYWLIRKRRSHPAALVDLRKPWEIAYSDLALLKEKNYQAEGKCKQFYVELTDIIRAYLERIYERPVLDMTTEEFLGNIVESAIADGLYARLKSFLQFADLVKFAKLMPETEKVQSDFEEAVGMVEFIRQEEMAKLAAASMVAPERQESSHV